MQYLRASFQVIGLEWIKIDRLRLDKYYNLLKCILLESFRVLKNYKWDQEIVESYSQFLMDVVFAPNNHYPNGIK
eukprot:Pgem_evm1s13220